MDSPPSYTTFDLSTFTYPQPPVLAPPRILTLVMKRVAPVTFNEDGAWSYGMLLEKRSDVILLYNDMTPDHIVRTIQMRISACFHAPLSEIGHPFHGESVKKASAAGVSGYGLSLGQPGSLLAGISVLDVHWLSYEDWVEEQRRVAKALKKKKKPWKSALWKVAMAFRRRH